MIKHILTTEPFVIEIPNLDEFVQNNKNEFTNIWQTIINEEKFTSAPRLLNGKTKRMVIERLSWEYKKDIIKHIELNNGIMGGAHGLALAWIKFRELLPVCSIYGFDYEQNLPKNPKMHNWEVVPTMHKFTDVNRREKDSYYFVSETVTGSFTVASFIYFID